MCIHQQEKFCLKVVKDDTNMLIYYEAVDHILAIIVKQTLSQIPIPP